MLLEGVGAPTTLGLGDHFPTPSMSQLFDGSAPFCFFVLRAQFTCVAVELPPTRWVRVPGLGGERRQPKTLRMEASLAALDTQHGLPEHVTRFSVDNIWFANLVCILQSALILFCVLRGKFEVSSEAVEISGRIHF